MKEFINTAEIQASFTRSFMLKCSYNQMGLPVSTQPDGWMDGWMD